MFGLAILILLNLGLGYTIALCLHRADLLPAAAARFFPTPTLVPAIDSAWTPTGTLPAAGSGSPTPTSTPTTPDASAEEISPATASNDPVSDSAPDTNASAAAPEPNAADSVAAESAPPDSAAAEIPVAASSPAPPEPDAEHRAAECTMLAFKTDLNGYCSELGSINDHVRKLGPEVSTENIKEYVAQFEQLSDHYLQQQQQRLQSLSECSQADIQAVAQPCVIAAQEHNAAIATTRESMAGAAKLADAAAACRDFLLATGRLAEANYSFHQELECTLNRIREPEQKSADSIETLEKAIAEFVSIQPDPDAKYSVALVEIDEMKAINRQHGRPITEKILQTVEHTFAAMAPRSTLATDPQRQQLLYFQSESTAREATHGVEVVRQRIAAMTFQHAESRLPVTISCGVAEATGAEAPTPIIKRMAEMLREAQRYGRNCTFFQEGQHSAPAIAPSVSVEPRLIEV